MNETMTYAEASAFWGISDLPLNISSSERIDRITDGGQVIVRQPGPF